MAKEQNYVFFDLETTSTDVASTEIVQIAAIATGPAPTFTEIEEFEIKIIPSAKGLAEIETARLTGFNHVYTAVAWKTAYTLPNALQSFNEFLKDYATKVNFAKTGKLYTVAQLVGHNVAGFDAPILFRHVKAIKLFLKADFRVMDTLQLAFWLSNIAGKSIQSYKLADLAELFGVELVRAHDALSDVEATIGITRALLASVKNDE
jgi:DNA polymerase III alpha subunit (gram-positive type)